MGSWAALAGCHDSKVLPSLWPKWRRGFTADLGRIHAVGPNYTELMCSTNVPMDACDTLVANAYTNSLKCAEQRGLTNVAFSLLSAGIFRGAQTLHNVLKLGITGIHEGWYAGLTEVHLVAFNKAELAALEEVCSAEAAGLKAGAVAAKVAPPLHSSTTPMAEPTARVIDLTPPPLSAKPAASNTPPATRSPLPSPDTVISTAAPSEPTATCYDLSFPSPSPTDAAAPSNVPVSTEWDMPTVEKWFQRTLELANQRWKQSWDATRDRESALADRSASVEAEWDAAKANLPYALRDNLRSCLLRDPFEAT